MSFSSVKDCYSVLMDGEDKSHLTHVHMYTHVDINIFKNMFNNP